MELVTEPSSFCLVPSKNTDTQVCREKKRESASERARAYITKQPSKEMGEQTSKPTGWGYLWDDQ